jgi:hypothetical protein
MSSQDFKGGRRSGGYVAPLAIIVLSVPGSPVLIPNVRRGRLHLRRMVYRKVDFLAVTDAAVLLIYERENKPCFSLELSHIQFINYSLHIVDLFHISCHDISIVITSLVTRTTRIYYNTMCRALLLIIACVHRHLTVF